MSGEIIPNKTESPSSKLLEAFKELFGLIEAEGTQNILESSERVTRLIFERLLANGNIAESTTYEDWLAVAFPSDKSFKPTQLVQIAVENGLMSEAIESKLLKVKLGKMLNTYLSQNKFNTNQELVIEVRKVQSEQKILTIAEYKQLAERLLTNTYGV